MKKRMLALILAAGLLAFALSGCAGSGKEYRAYDYSFDTDITLIAVCESEEAFDGLRELIFGTMRSLHCAFDIYDEYDGANNLATVNSLAGQPVAVREEILDLLTFAKEMYDRTGGRVNVAMGSVLSQWKTARDTGVLPDPAALEAARDHCNIDDVVINKSAGTVTLRDPEMSLDVGAVAKGWAAQRAAEAADAAGYSDFILSAGGNVVVRGTGLNGRAWRIGIRDPQSEDGSGVAMALDGADGMCLVTSGGYERNLTVDGKTYCHIIDPDTLYPADKVLSATVICDDSGLADGLSTALFLMEPQEGLDLAKSMGVRAVIIDKTGAVLDTAEAS